MIPAHKCALECRLLSRGTAKTNPAHVSLPEQVDGAHGAGSRSRGPPAPRPSRPPRRLFGAPRARGRRCSASAQVLPRSGQARSRRMPGTSGQVRSTSEAPGRARPSRARFGGTTAGGPPMRVVRRFGYPGGHGSPSPPAVAARDLGSRPPIVADVRRPRVVCAPRVASGGRKALGGETKLSYRPFCPSSWGAIPQDQV